MLRGILEHCFADEDISEEGKLESQGRRLLTIIAQMMRTSVQFNLSNSVDYFTLLSDLLSTVSLITSPNTYYEMLFFTVEPVNYVLNASFVYQILQFLSRLWYERICSTAKVTISQLACNWSALLTSSSNFFFSSEGLVLCRRFLLSYFVNNI